MKKFGNFNSLIVLLAILSAIAPVSVDTYIPAIPSMAKDFDVNIEQIELTLSIFLIGFAIGQVFGGSFSDRVGRKRSSLVGLFGFALFSFLIIFSSSVYELWVYRFAEAFFGGLIVVNGTAITRDVFHAKEAAKAFSLIGSIRSFAPLIAPFIGTAILYFYSWEMIFVFLVIFSLTMALYMMKYFKETYTYKKQNVIESYKSVLKHKRAMQVMLILAFTFSGMFTIIAKSSFIYIEYFNISTAMFPLYFGVNFVVLILFIKVNIQLLKTYQTKYLIKYAIFLQILIGLVFIYNASDISKIMAVILIAVYMGLTAFVYGNASAMALEHFPINAGVASSVLGVVQFGVGAFLSSLVLMVESKSLYPVAISITIMSFCAYLLIRNYKSEF